MPLTKDINIEVTDKEAKVLEKGRGEKPYYPKTKSEQVIVCRLMEREMMTINGQMHNDNRCFTTFLGGYALATWAGKGIK
jgi:hypothetical protein